MSKQKSIKERMNEMNRFTLADAKEVATKVYKNKPVFYGVVTGATAFIATSAGILASLGLGVIVTQGHKFFTNKPNEDKKDA